MLFKPDNSISSLQEYEHTGLKALFAYHAPALLMFTLMTALAMLAVAASGELISADMGIYITCANAVRTPELFTSCTAYSDMQQYGIYAYTLTPMVLRAAIELTGSYAPGVQWLTGLNTFFLLAGFYLFCNAVMRNRLNAFLSTLILCAPLHVGWADHWGVDLQGVPRTTYVCFFIGLFGMALLTRRRPSLWPVVMTLQGFLVFVHPISAFSTALGLWCSFLPFLPWSWTLRKKTAWMLLCGVCFLVSSLPAYILLLHHTGPYISYDAWLAAWAVRMDWDSFYHGLGSFILRFIIVLPFIPAALFIGGRLYRMRGECREVTQFCAFFALGILLTVGMYFGFHHLFAALKQIPPNTQLIRATRFLVFISLFVLVYGLNRLHDPACTLRYRLSLVTILLYMGTVGPGFSIARQVVSDSLSVLAATPTDNSTAAYLELVEFARSTPPNSRFMGPVDLIPLRNMALRPLAYSFKDSASLLISRNPAIVSWHEATLRLVNFKPSFEPTPDPSRFIPALLDKPAEAFRCAIRIITLIADNYHSGGLWAVFENRAQYRNALTEASITIWNRTSRWVPPSASVWMEEAQRLDSDFLVLDTATYPQNIMPQGADAVWQNGYYAVYPVNGRAQTTPSTPTKG